MLEYFSLDNELVNNRYNLVIENFHMLIGPKGDTGDTGPQGPAGADGDTFWTQSSNDIYYNSGNVGIKNTSSRVPP